MNLPFSRSRTKLVDFIELNNNNNNNNLDELLLSYSKETKELMKNSQNVNFNDKNSDKSNYWEKNNSSIKY